MTTTDDHGKKPTIRRGGRGGGFRPASESAAAILTPVLRRQGFAEAGILRHWPEIAGAGLAVHARPERLRWPRRENDDEGATLYLLVASGWALEVQHFAPVIIERVNRFFGWRAVSELKLRQGVVAAPPVRKPPKQRALSPAELAGLEQALAGVEDPALRQRLERLGRAVFAAEPESRAPSGGRDA